MHPITTGLLVFACVFGGAMLGLRLRAALPHPHLNADTKDVVKLAMGLVATMTALILGLLIASAKSSYDAQKNGLVQLAAKLVSLDRMLAIYGPETAEARRLLRITVEESLANMWPNENSQPARLEPNIARGPALYHAVQKLSPTDDEHRGLKSQSVQMVVDLGQMRWLLFEESGSSISVPLLIVVSVWLAVIFTSFALFAPANLTVVVALMVAALCVAGSIFLILELDQPYGGIIHIPSAPMRSALEHLGK